MQGYEILSNILAPKFHRCQFCFSLNPLMVVEVNILINEPPCFRKSLYLNSVYALRFSKEIYSLRISAPSDGIFRFVKVFYQENGAVDGIKYRFGDRYLFIFASEYNLIVTKSIMDLTEEDDTPVPIYDPSILFDNVLLSSGYNLDQKRHETSTIVYINLDYYS